MTTSILAPDWDYIHHYGQLDLPLGLGTMNAGTSSICMLCTGQLPVRHCTV